MNGLGLAAALAAAAPVGRDEARRAAERELSKGIYHRNDPGVIERAINAVLEWLDKLLSRTANATPGGGLGLLVLVLAIIGVLVFVAWRVGPVRRTSRSGRAAAVELSGPLDADEHRRRADAFAADRRYAEAVRERMRAIVRELEARGVLEPRPGRTADEVARDAGSVVPVIASDLHAAAHQFDEVWYGGRTATAEADAVLRQADERVRRARLAVTGAGRLAAAGYPGGYEVPR